MVNRRSRTFPLSSGTSLRAQTLLQLTARECGLIVVALPIVAVVRLALWILPSRLILRFLSRLSASRSAETSHGSVAPSAIPWAVEAASRAVPRATCLTQAVAAKLLLRLSGEDAQFCLGVAYTSEGALRAHAWLERDGRAILGGAGVKSMVRLPELPDPAPLPASFIR